MSNEWKNQQTNSEKKLNDSAIYRVEKKIQSQNYQLLVNTNPNHFHSFTNLNVIYKRTTIFILINTLLLICQPKQFIIHYIYMNGDITC